MTVSPTARHDSFNVFELGIVICGIIELTYDILDISSNTKVFRAFKIFRALRVLRVLRLVTVVKSMRVVVDTLLLCLWDLAYVLLLLFMFMYMFMLLGMQVRSDPGGGGLLDLPP